LYITTSDVDFDRAADTPWRIRFLIQETAGGMESNKTFKLQRSWSGGGGWVDVTTSSSVVKAVPHPYINDASDCTQQIGAGTFIANNDGFSHDGTCGGSGMDFQSNEAECEFVIEIIGSDVTTGQTIDFRVVETDDTELSNYTFTPTVTIIDEVITTIGSNDRTTTISAVSGSDPYTVTISDGSIVDVGDACWDENAVPRKYRVTAISGNDLTVVDSEGVGSAPDNSGTTTPSDIKRYYATLAAWETDLDDTDLYQAGDDAVAEMYDDAAFNMGSLTVSGGGTVKLNSAQIRAASGEEHGGTLDGGVVIRGASVTGNIIDVTHGDVYTVVQGLEIDFNGDSGDSGINTGIQFNNSTVIGAIRRNIIHYSARRLHSGIKEASSGFYGDIHNNWVFNFVYGGTSAAIPSAGINIGTSRKINVFNNTVHEIQFSNASNTGDVFGIRFPDDSAKDIRNNICTDCTTAGGGTAADYSQASPANATVDYNIASDTSASGASSHDSESSSTLFESNSSPYDLHLASGATNAIDGGVDLGIVPFGVELDIDKYDRDAGAVTWDIGADERVAVGRTTKNTRAYPLGIRHATPFVTTQIP
jgi:hypothetical protein